MSLVTGNISNPRDSMVSKAPKMPGRWRSNQIELLLGLVPKQEF
jgi:hypothetical protein